MRPATQIFQMFQQIKRHCVHHYLRHQLAKFNLSSTVIAELHHSAMLFVSWRLNTMPKWATFSRNFAREIDFGSFGGETDGEHNGIYFVDIWYARRVFLWNGVIWQNVQNWPLRLNGSDLFLLQHLQLHWNIPVALIISTIVCSLKKENTFGSLAYIHFCNDSGSFKRKILL